MIVLGIIFTVLQGLDLLTTNIAIKYGCQEANPLLKDSLEGKGFPLYLAIIKITMGIFLTILITIGSIILNVIVVFLNVLMGIVVINNLIRIPIQRKYNKIFFMESATLMKFMHIWDVRTWVAAIQNIHIKRKSPQNRWKRKAFSNVRTVRAWIKRIHQAKEQKK